VSKVTSKLQVTIPKAIAERYSIEPGDELEWVPAGDTVRVVPAKVITQSSASVASRLKLFDAATQRQRKREAERPKRQRGQGRGWTREELYERGGSR
jgi:AbrB family looped-hinge helix DNA binding protein